MTKSEATFHINVARMFEAGHPILVTLTFAEVHPIKQAMGLWFQFQRELVRFGHSAGKNTINGLRVAELHDEDESGHGLHFHVLLNRFVSIEIVRSIAEKYGFYWLQMKECYSASGLSSYLAKYLAPRSRPPCLKGKRLWAAFGKWGHSKVKNVVCRSEFCAAYKAAQSLLETRIRACQHKMSGCSEPTNYWVRMGQELKELSLLTQWEKHQYYIEHAVSHVAAVLRGTRSPLTANFMATSKNDVGWLDEHIQKQIPLDCVA